MSSSGSTGMTLTTEAVQALLEENQQLIEAIISNQNRGKLDACAAYQGKLHQNLKFLATVADQQPAGAQPPQMAPVPTNPASNPHPVIASGSPSASQLSRESAAEKKEVRYWTEEEHQRFLEGIRKYSQEGKFDLKAISKYVGTRTPVQIRSHLQKYLLKQRQASPPSERSLSGDPHARSTAHGAADHGADSSHTAERP